MKKRFISLLKYCRPIYALYYVLGTAFFRLVRLFIKTDEKLILFGSFGGKSFNDSPRAIYQSMLSDPRFRDYHFVWAFSNPAQFRLKHAKTIKNDTFSYFVTCMKARCWITNSSLERGLGIRGKHTYFVDTWHGTPLKKMGSDITSNEQVFSSKNSWNMDLFTTQCAYESRIFTRAFHLKEGICQVVGLPRNDELAHADEASRRYCRGKLGLKDEQKVILYAPTFRDYVKNNSLQKVFAPPVDFANWRAVLGDDTVVLVRAHYESVAEIDRNSKGIIDVSDWPSINELMIASDLLISDYSSVLFDYSIMERPMISFAYDYEEYEKERGMYFDIRKKIDWAENEADLLSWIISMRDEERYTAAIALTRAFREEFVESAGTATDRVLDIIYENL